MPVTVCKLGGSLLNQPDLADRLARLISLLNERQILLIVGGGAAADVVREWDRQHQLGAERAHWLALRSMMLNESLVLELLPNARLVQNRDEAEAAWSKSRIAVLCAHDFLIAEEQVCDDVLPHTWDVTSDSVAAWIAIQWPASRLVLAKSVPLSNITAPRELENTVDPYFRKLSPRISQIDWINLRDEVSTVQSFCCTD